MKKERNAKIATNVSLLVRLHKIEMKEELIKDCLAYVSARFPQLHFADFVV